MNIEHHPKLREVEVPGPLNETISELKSAFEKHGGRTSVGPVVLQSAQRLAHAIQTRSEQDFRESHGDLERMNFNFGGDRFDDVLAANELNAAKIAVLRTAKAVWDEKSAAPETKAA